MQKQLKYITFILNNNRSAGNPKDFANIFNNFFDNDGETAEKGIPQGNHSPLTYLRGNFHMKLGLLRVT